MEVVPCVVTERSTSAKGVSVRSMQTCQWNCPAVGWRKSWTNGWNSERNTLYRIRESENRTNVVEFVVGNNFRVEKAAEKHERKRRINRVMEYILDSTRLGSIPRRIIPVIPDVRRGTKWHTASKITAVSSICDSNNGHLPGGGVKVVGTMVAGGSSRNGI